MWQAEIQTDVPMPPGCKDEPDELRLGDTAASGAVSVADAIRRLECLFKAGLPAGY
jgi:hypothetical protein